MQPFLFLRHGETDWNLADRVQGRTDNPLNGTGLLQADRAAAALAHAPIGLIIASPLQRAHKAAQIIADTVKAPVVIDEGLLERDYGGIEGWLPDRMRAAFGDAADATMALHPSYHAEGMDNLATRAQAAIFKTLQADPDRLVLFVAHGTWFRAFVRSVSERQDFYPENCVPYVCQPAESGWHVLPLTDIGVLKQQIS